MRKILWVCITYFLCIVYTGAQKCNIDKVRNLSKISDLAVHTIWFIFIKVGIKYIGNVRNDYILPVVI